MMSGFRFSPSPLRGDFEILGLMGGRIEEHS